MAGLTNAHIQHLILTGTGVKPTIPNPVTATPDDTTWVDATDILRGELSYNTTDKIWYTRTNADAIVEINPERTGYKLLSTGINTINFSVPFADTNYFVLCYYIDSGGGVQAGAVILNKTASSFQVTANINDQIWYLAKHL